MLNGVRVLDFSRFLPGGFASQRLALVGAEVIKVEAPGGGDPTRTRGGGSVFSAVNRRKKSITINLKEPEGRILAFRLACLADVVIESFRPGVAASLGLGFETLRGNKPDLVYCSLTGYGQTGPLSRLGGHDLNFLAYSGLLAQLKDSSGRPVVPSFQFGDLIGGLAASEAILAALVKRSLTGQGSYLDSGSTRALTDMMAVHTVIHQTHGTQQGIEELTGSIVSYNLYETADGRFMSLAALEPKFWANFCRAVGHGEWQDALFSPAAADNPVFRQVMALFKTRTFGEWSEFSRTVDCCLAPILETDEIESDFPDSDAWAVPALGQHNREVFADLLGLSEKQVRNFHERGII